MGRVYNNGRDEVMARERRATQLGGITEAFFGFGVKMGIEWEHWDSIDYRASV